MSFVVFLLFFLVLLWFLMVLLLFPCFSAAGMLCGARAGAVPGAWRPTPQACGRVRVKKLGDEVKGAKGYKG